MTISKKKLSPGDTTILAFVAIIMNLINHLALSINGGLISLNKVFYKNVDCFIDTVNHLNMA